MGVAQEVEIFPVLCVASAIGAGVIAHRVGVGEDVHEDADVGHFVAVVISVFVRLGSARGMERQEIKWFAYAAAVLLGCVFFSPWIAWALPWWISLPVGVVGLCAIPLAVGIAVLRYRLHDIDRIINRTLVYGLLTAMLIALYFGGVAATEGILRALTGQEEQPPLAVVVSTLVIAALFTPLRRRIQSFIDRRFYGWKYDARKTLEAFSAKLKDETDLEAQNNELVGMRGRRCSPHTSLCGCAPMLVRGSAERGAVASSTARAAQDYTRTTLAGEPNPHHAARLQTDSERQSRCPNRRSPLAARSRATAPVAPHFKALAMTEAAYVEAKRRRDQ